jgi:hypothetical protein
MYEREHGRFNTDIQRDELKRVVSKLLLSILERVQTSSTVTLDPFRAIVLEALFVVGIGKPYPTELFDSILSVVQSSVVELPGEHIDLLRDLKDYGNLIKNAVLDLRSFSASSVFDILQLPAEYQYSEEKVYLSPKQTDTITRKVYTLFPPERYWETFKQLSDPTSYSPLSYNRVASRIGRHLYRVDIDYNDLIIYEEELYKLVPGVSSPSREVFKPEQWTKHVSKRLNNLDRFKESFERNIERYYAGFLENGFDVNEISSDSKIHEYSPDESIDKDLLGVTFGGEGKALLDSIRRLKVLGDYFGSHEGSVVGGVEYITRYSEYLLACAYGRNEGDVFEIINNQTAFGKFDLLFASRTTTDRIPGLGFLKGFLGLRSFTHNQKVPATVDISTKPVVYNPVYAQFVDGIADRYVPSVKKKSYTPAPEIDLLLSGIEALYRACLHVGDLTQATLKSLDKNGRLKGHEGLGSMKPQLDELQRVFPPSTYMGELETSMGPGLSGGVRLLLSTYSKLSRTFVYSRLPGGPLEFMLRISSLIKEQVENTIDIIRKLSISSFSYVPNVSNKSFQSQNPVIINFLRSLGFKDSEVNSLLEVGDFQGLISTFAPLSDSADIKSFFKGFELSQLIYELAGDKGIEAYLSFLYSTSAIDGLLNILSIAQISKSNTTYFQTDRYPRLIGLLIGLTYAVDPGQLVKFTEILGKNDLTLLDSITYLLQSGQDNIIKSKEDVELLQPVIDQVIRGNYADPFSSPDLTYTQADQVVPIALKQWTQLIGSNLGNISSREIVEGLYDKSVGLTPKELLYALNISSPNTPLGQMLDGFNGGNFTRFLQYANITGLSIKLGYYRNSSQLNNFELERTASPLGIFPLMEGLERVKDVIEVINIIFESNLDYTYTQETDDKFQALLNAQNKTYETLSSTVSKILSSPTDERVLEAKSFAGNAPILESPGIGNSRLPNRIPVINSITPEQYEALFSQNAVSGQEYLIQSSLPSSLINRFIKFTEENKLINQIDQVNETYELTNPVREGISWQPASDYETPPMDTSLQPLEYKVPRVYVDEENLSPEQFSPLQVPSELLKAFDPVTSCKRFGGSNCEELYDKVADRCVPNLNKSTYPEEYKSIPGVLPSTVSIDRPLGTAPDKKPSKALVATSQYKTPPAYTRLLEGSISGFGNRGEPLVSGVFSPPLVFERGGGEVSEYNNTEFGITEGIKSGLEKDAEFNCATLSSPFEYQMCMNILKCKRFSTPFDGRYVLDFCPRTTAGGRLKR